MSEKLFNVPKIGLFLDGYAPGVEKRRGEEVKILTLTLRVQPFDHKLAIAIDDGLGGDVGVRGQLFSLSTGDPKPHLERLNFNLGCPRQTMKIFAAPDIDEARILFTQVKISGTYARTQKDANGFAFVFRASFGPVGREDLEFLNHWYLSQQFVTFEQAEPSLAFGDGDDEDTEVGEVVDGRPLRAGGEPPMWDDGEMDPSAAVRESEKAREEGAPKPARRGTKNKRQRHTPEADRADQVEAGRAAAAQGESVEGERVTHAGHDAGLYDATCPDCQAGEAAAAAAVEAAAEETGDEGIEP